MNLWQTLRQIQKKLQDRDWSGGSENVFASSSVFVTMDSRLEAIETKIPPIAEIRSQAGQADPEYSEWPELKERTITIRLYVFHTDEVGEMAVMGGNRSGGLLSSKGRGVLEVEPEVLDAVQKLSDESGIRIQFVGAGNSGTEIDSRQRWLAWQDYDFRAWCTTARFYHPCRKFVATAGSGQVAMTWALPPSRFDFYRPRLVRKTGSTAPTSPTDGTELTLSPTQTAVSHTDTIAAGTYSYSLFASYDDVGPTPATDRNYSDPLTRTGLVVT